MKKKATFVDGSEVVAAWGDEMDIILQSKSRFIVSGMGFFFIKDCD